jgi:hypothetical protein
MPREKEDFREILARLTERFPGRAAISIQEAAPILGRCVKTLTYDKNFPKVKIGNSW